MEYYTLDPDAESIHPLTELFPSVKWWYQPHNRTYDLLQIETPADKPFRGHRKVVNTLKKAVVDAHADRWAGAPEIQLQDVRVRLEAIGQILHTWEERIGPRLEKGAGILSAWLCETAKGVPKMRTPDLYRESSHLWYLVKHGPPGDGGDGLIHFFDALCDRYSTPPNFAKAQRSMLRWLLKLVDELKSEIVIVDDERLAYEEIQKDLLLRPGIDGNQEQDQQSFSHSGPVLLDAHHNAKWNQLLQFLAVAMLEKRGARRAELAIHFGVVCARYEEAKSYCEERGIDPVDIHLDFLGRLKKRANRFL